MPANQAKQARALDVSDLLSGRDYAVVVAHPDDEVLWCGSVLAGARRIVLCYGDYAPDAAIGRGRRAALAGYPLRSLSFLELPEQVFHDSADWRNPRSDGCGMFIDDVAVRERYAANFERLVAALEPQLQDVGAVFTHNPWGEYGHEDHVQVHQAVKSIAVRRGIRMLVPDFFSPKSAKMMQRTRAQCSPIAWTHAVDRQQAQAIRDLYQRNGCWTWIADWQPPQQDRFLVVSMGDVSAESVGIQVADIFQTLLVDGGAVPEGIPHLLSQNIDSVRAAYPDARHHLLGGNEVREFIASRFAPEVVEAYDLLRPYAFKSDLARYCLLYACGGLYVDVGIRLFRPLAIPEGRQIVCFRDLTRSSNTTWAVSNGVLYSAPGREEFRLAIQLIVENCLQHHYGTTPLCPTGPVLLGRTLAMVYPPAEYHCGELRLLTPEFDDPRLALVDPEGNIVGARIRPKEGGPLGLPGTNDYTTLWRTKQVYGELQMSWSSRDPAIHCRDGRRGEHGISIIADEDGYQVYGPYVNLGPGQYRAELQFSCAAEAGGPFIDVASDAGSKIHAVSEAVDTKVGDNGIATIEFTLRESADAVEVRVGSSGRFSGLFLGMKLSRSPDAGPLRPRQGLFDLETTT